MSVKNVSVFFEGGFTVTNRVSRVLNSFMFLVKHKKPAEEYKIMANYWIEETPKIFKDISVTLGNKIEHPSTKENFQIVRVHLKDKEIMSIHIDYA